MVSRYASNPLCADCGKRKGKNQVNGLRCFSCQKSVGRKASETKHGAHIQKTYGISLALYNLLYAYQGGKCAICRRASGKSRRLSVDHSHKCKEGHAPSLGCLKCVRGLLCSVCNTFIGRMHDDPEVGDRMGSYLRSPPFQEMMSLTALV